MRIVRGVKNFTERLPNPVLTLGNFDGVHLGHQAIFRKVVERAREIGGTSVAFTFEPHPLKVLSPERSPQLLNTFHGKLRLFEAAGIEVVICANFTRVFADQHPEDFAREVLHKQIGVKEVYVGMTTPSAGTGEASVLKRMGADLWVQSRCIEPVQVDGSWSATPRTRSHNGGRVGRRSPSRQILYNRRRGGARVAPRPHAAFHREY
jgi:riboflavin kinase/FMN adenylyltransferase